ncbi:Acidic leucine-rich nuclear phosphoprotein 32-related protein [Vitis vinifera]|uniref:Acidic leucine-rich nuclear phosphoprotein 32-related protein n=1 Tax=Vitis vinifera TaxID=29760 RepID=A0A438JTU3_VITVI|nr:Acidic leucine-rich nuclear phosphoprotein 32-related protein [Vitis vinifera]
MDEIWERAVETAIDGKTDASPVRSLTLDGAVKCYSGGLPPPTLLEKFQNLEHLSIANVGLSSLEKFPRLGNLQRLILSDNRISGGLEFLVEANLQSLRDLDLSNNRIQYFEDLAPLARLKLVSLDLYECPVTKIKDYRARVFGLIETLKYLDKLDFDENEEDDEDEDEEDDGEIDEDGVVGLENGDVEDDGDDDDLEDVNVEESGDDEVVEVHEIDDSDEEEGVEEDDDEEDDDGDEEVEDEEEDVRPGIEGRGIGNGGEIDGHEQGEEDSDDDGEYEEEDGEDEEEAFHIRPVRRAEEDGEASDVDPENEVDDVVEVEEEVEDAVQLPREAQLPSSSQSRLKRKRDEENDGADNSDDESVEDVSLKPH